MAVQAREVCNRMNFENCFAVNRNGLGGGLALCWSSEVHVNISSFSNHHIDAVVQSENGKYWRCTGIYGHPETQQKQHTWTLFRRLASLSDLPWLCFGDFNEILDPREKNGGQDRNVNMMLSFREAVQVCNLIDVGCKGYPFTWSNRRFSPHLVEERLDRFFCSKDWANSFFDSPATNLLTVGFDHCPVLMEVKERVQCESYARKSFPRVHYEDMWSAYNMCKSIVQDEWSNCGSWKNGDPVLQFQKSAKNSMARLKGWSKREFGGREEELKRLRKQLERVKQNLEHYDGGDEYRRLENRIHNLLIDEEMFWKQRSRADWLKEGDQNTKFFHAKASARKMKNKIWGIEDGQGKWTEDIAKVEAEFCEYFQEIFTSSRTSQVQIDSALAGLMPKVTQDMKSMLEQPFTAEEVSNALSQMCPTKAPGPDGLPAVFFQKHWLTVGGGVIETCLHVLNEQGTLSQLNHTYIALIPKVHKPRKVTEFRPISLCNVIYRLIAKTIANRMKPILAQIISPNQSAFIPNRLITDNIIIGYECLHKIRHSKGKRNGLVALNLVFTKASVDSCKNLKAIFDCYAAASGQLFNFEKSSLVFSGSIPEDRAEAIKNIFQLNVVSRHGKYLGLPSMVGRKKTSFFNEVKLKVVSKIASWQHRLFSSGGKEVLIKAVAQAIPAYAMSVFKLPLGLCDDIQKAMAKFWWRSKEDKRGIHWARWGKMSHAKSRGGLGFREMSSFNRALVAKQGWRLLQYPDLLVTRVLKARYYKETDFLQARAGSNPSYIWRSILWGRQVLQKGIRWRIGSGEKIQICRDNWIPRPETFKPISTQNVAADASVADLISLGNSWDQRKVRQWFMDEDAAKILRIPLPRRPRMDEVIWHFDKKGQYSVKSGYQLALKIQIPDKPSCSSKGCTIGICYGPFNCRKKLKSSCGEHLTTFCLLLIIYGEERYCWSLHVKICKQGKETTAHTLLLCKAAKKVWRYAPFETCFPDAVNQDMLEIMVEMTKKLTKSDIEVMVAICWTIWYGRNKFLFEGKKMEPLLTISRAEAVVEAYRRVKQPPLDPEAKYSSKNQQVWSPPPDNTFKVNVDAAVNFDRQKAGLGVVIRDSSNKVKVAAVKSTLFTGDVQTTEAEAVEWGLVVAKSAAFQCIMVESDCQEVVKLINNNEGSRTEIMWVISEIQSLSKDFQNISCYHTPRSCNTHAHSLAKLALRNNETVVWLEPIPVEVESVLSSLI
ncbi:reverse transcriptase domain-containing protein [Citrus sinensis]|uniref:Reverse transcriptase domain-containing protein n=1 Tax=Citrus sinensis TaxID=2711 RepID=A0ACB8JJC1_CITSI|nr:reverse transcriptase domain-containing protein [Citrus sinensis]